MRMQNYDERLNHLIEEALKEDVGDGDHTTLSCIPPEKTGRAVLKIKQDGILAGVEVAERIFSFVEAQVSFNAFKRDGDKMYNGETAFELRAHIHTILKCERLVLNCMQRMSGIAGLTHQYAQKLKGYKTKIAGYAENNTQFSVTGKRSGKNRWWH